MSRPLGPEAGQPAPRGESAPIDPHRPEARASLDRYWKMNLLVMRGLLLIWFLAGLGCGVLWADWLNGFKVAGFSLGFWFAQQGSIASFVLIILVYSLLMNRLDRKHHEELRKIRNRGGGTHVEH